MAKTIRKNARGKRKQTDIDRNHALYLKALHDASNCPDTCQFCKNENEALNAEWRERRS